MPHLTQALIKDGIAEAKTSGKEGKEWDDDPRGLGIRFKPSGVASFFIQYRSPVTFKKTRFTVSQYGRLTIDQARTKAKRLFEAVADGRCPALEKKQMKHAADTAVTVSDFCNDYLRDAKAGLVTYRGRPKKPSTIAIDEGRIERHIKPTLGDKLVRDVTTREIERAMHDIRLGKTATNVKTKPRGRAIVKGGPGTAGQAVILLGSIFSYAIKLGIREDNPVRGVERPPTNKRDRILSPKEYKKLGTALQGAQETGKNEIAIRAALVLALTGCRRGEIYALKKSEIDPHHQCLRFGDTKTGQQVRPVGRAAMDLLTLPAFNDKSDYVFPTASGDRHLTDAKLFRSICGGAGLKGVSLHTLRHSFASVALEHEYSEMTIAGLLGHRRHSVTSRYAHHVDRALIAAADRVSAVILARLEGRKDVGNVVQFASGTQ